MNAALLADLVLVLHFGFILFVALGGLLVARFGKLAWLHLPAVAWGILIELADWRCPLTPLENRLRELAGERGYQGSFVEHYLLPLIYPEGLTRGIQLMLAAAIVLLNLVTYAIVIELSRRESRGKMLRSK